MMVKNRMAGVAAIAATLLSGCVHTAFVKPNYSLLQQSYVDKVMACPLEVGFGKDQIQDAWGRAQAFIAKYSDMKLQVVTDYSIQTYNPERIFMFGYAATKIPTKEGFTIDVDCDSAASLSRSTKERLKSVINLNAHIFSYYVETGELPFPELICTYATRRVFTQKRED